MYDAIVVGARCAGSPTAMLLARQGYRVVLVDRASFPSETLSGHFMYPSAVEHLVRWGLLDKVRASGCPPIREVTLHCGDFPLTGRPPLPDGLSGAFAPRRAGLDKVLVDAAVGAGAELRDGFRVEELVWDGDRVAGVRGRTRSGATTSVRGRIVVGADGMRSRVAQAVAAPAYWTTPSRTASYLTYWSGVRIDGLEAYFLDRRVILAFPTDDGLVCTCVQWPRAELHDVRADAEASMLRALDLASTLAGRIRQGRRAERLVGTADQPGFFRKPYGPGWALVGDAGYHQDPMTAQGIKDAFRDAGLLAAAIDDGFSGRRPLDDALATYEQRRNAAALPMYRMTGRLIAFPPHAPSLLSLRRALQGNREDTDRYCGTVFETVPLQEFYDPMNVWRILASAVRR